MNLVQAGSRAKSGVQLPGLPELGARPCPSRNLAYLLGAAAPALVGAALARRISFCRRIWDVMKETRWPRRRKRGASRPEKMLVKKACTGDRQQWNNGASMLGEWVPRGLGSQPRGWGGRHLPQARVVGPTILILSFLVTQVCRNKTKVKTRNLLPGQDKLAALGACGEDTEGNHKVKDGGIRQPPPLHPLHNTPVHRWQMTPHPRPRSRATHSPLQLWSSVSNTKSDAALTEEEAARERDRIVGNSSTNLLGPLVWTTPPPPLGSPAMATSPAPAEPCSCPESCRAALAPPSPGCDVRPVEAEGSVREGGRSRCGGAGIEANSDPIAACEEPPQPWCLPSPSSEGRPRILAALEGRSSPSRREEEEDVASRSAAGTSRTEPPSMSGYCSGCWGASASAATSDARAPDSSWRRLRDGCLGWGSADVAEDEDEGKGSVWDEEGDEEREGWAGPGVEAGEEEREEEREEEDGFFERGPLRGAGRRFNISLNLQMESSRG